MKIIELMEDHAQAEPIAKLYSGQHAQVMQLCLPPGGTIPPHRHDGDEVVLIPEKGSCRLDVDSETVVLSPGEPLCSDGAHNFVLSNEGPDEFKAIAILIKGASWTTELTRGSHPTHQAAKQCST